MVHVVIVSQVCCRYKGREERKTNLLPHLHSLQAVDTKAGLTVNPVDFVSSEPHCKLVCSSRLEAKTGDLKTNTSTADGAQPGQDVSDDNYPL